MTVNGYMVGDELAGAEFGDEQMRKFERDFRAINAHTYCGICHDGVPTRRAFVWPRNGFSKFPLDFKPGVVQTVQPV